MNSPKSISHPCWDFFDRIYCITLQSRPDRRQLAENQFAILGILPRVEFVVVSKHPVNPEQGIFQSHMRCLGKGLLQQARNILIFEDDVFFKGIDTDALAKACGFLESTGKWNAFFLGCITDGSKRTTDNHLARIKYRCLAHAYALNRPFAETIARQAWTGIPFDEVLRRNSNDFFALYPMCAFQGLAGTDNRTVVIDRLRRLLGGLPFIQKANEQYQNHKLVLLPASWALLLVLAVLTFRLW